MAEEAHSEPHQFIDEAQHHAAALSGMWLFLVTEIMFFSGVFAAYVVYRYLWPEVFHHFSRDLDVRLGTLNTAVLLTSSFTMALAVHHAGKSRQGRTAFYLFVTLCLALVFLVIKAMEWRHDFELGLFPSPYWTYQGPMADEGRLFFNLYFFMTGLHGLHVIIGVVLLAYFARQAWRLRTTALRVEVVGLYWHFVDLVWIFLFPLFYLVDRS